MSANVNWNPAEFHHWYTRMPSDQKARVWEDLRPDLRKQYTEWWTFGKFSRVAPLDIDPRTIESRLPPEPDIYCAMSRIGNYFELGEVTDQPLARSAGVAAKLGQDSYSGAFSQMGPLFRLFEQKCSKQYDTHGHPLHLLMHYSVGHQVPNTPLVRTEMSKHRQSIAARLGNSPFSSLWVFDGWDESIIEHIER